MPENLHFAFEIDLPLAAATLVGFILHFNYWARSKTADTSLDLTARLPAARLRVIGFFAALVFFCWITNIAVWAVFGFLLALGIAISILAGGEGDASGMFLMFAGYAIREWAFGFPQLILHPPQFAERDSKDAQELNSLAGMRGTTVSPLRPCGEAELDGRVVPVMSDNGQLMDEGTNVIVTGKRNGIFCVRPLGNN